MILYNNGYVLSKTFIIFKDINILLFSFNFLPIIPLDGSGLLNIIFSNFFSFYKSLNLTIYTSIITIIVVILAFNNLLIVILSIILIKEIINLIKNKEVIFNKFLLERYLYYFDFELGHNIKDIKNIRRNKKHNIIKEGKIMTEKEYLKKIFDKDLKI